MTKERSVDTKVKKWHWASHVTRLRTTDGARGQPAGPPESMLA